MPIDYSKFDGIGSDDEDEDPRRGGGGAGGRDFAELMKCLQQLSGKESNDGIVPDSLLAPPASDPGPPPCDPIGLSFGGRRAASGPFGGDRGYGDDFDDYGLDSFGQDAEGYRLDFAELREEAWSHLLQRMVVRPNHGGPAGVARALLLEAEVHMIASRYRQALVASLSLQILVDDISHDSRSVESSEECSRWAASASVVEMVSSYQLGDREHAVKLRDSLSKADRSFLSEHLAKRYDGTSEVLELVPQFIELMKAAEQQDRAMR